MSGCFYSNAHSINVRYVLLTSLFVFHSRSLCISLRGKLTENVNVVNAVSSVPMQNVAKPTRGRSMSMQDYDIPLRQRMNNTQMTCSPVIDASPSSVDGDGAAAGGADGGGGGGGGGAALSATTAGTEQLVAN